MDRDIKFRAFWKDTGKKIEDFNEEYLVEACNSEYFIVQQYTGLKDKNGKEIYEGDIVKIPTLSNTNENIFDLVIIVIKYGCVFWQDHFTKKLELIYNYIGDSDKDEDAEILGNIFENENLIK